MLKIAPTFLSYRQILNRNYTRDGRFFPDNLFYRYILPEKTVLVCSKRDYFRFARDNDFAPEAKYRYDQENPRYYIQALSRCIRSKAERGYVLDMEESRGDFFVFEYAEDSLLDIPNSERIARNLLTEK